MTGNYGIYGIIDQMLFSSPYGKKKSDSQPQEGLGFFHRLALQPANRNILQFYCDTGLTYQGLFPSRHEDLLGIALAYGLLSNDWVEATKQSQGIAPSRTTYDLELTYQIQVTHWLTIQPDLQYLIHPGTTQTYPNAFVLGLRSSIVF